MRMRSPILLRVWNIWWILLPAALGTFVRILYVLKTPFSVRSHDYLAHVDYVTFVAEHWRMPLAAEGWEFYHPPLYYFLAGAWWKLGSQFGFQRDALIVQLQWGSTFLSWLLVPLALWISTELFTTKQRVQRALLASVIAVIPALVFTGSRISNDVLFQSVAVATIGALLHWYRGGTPWAWYLVCILIGVGTVTKLNMLPLLIMTPVVFLFRSRPWSLTTMKRLGIGAIIIVMLSGWLPVLRSQEPQHRSLIPGPEKLEQSVLLENTLRNFITFNPLAVWRIPYNNPRGDVTRRHNFLEYLYRSAFVGEWDFGDALRPISIAMLYLGFVVLLLAVLGLLQARMLPDQLWFPLLMITLAFIGGAAAFRFVNTCSCSQDFRYITPITLPLTAFAVHGASSLPAYLKPLALGFLWTFVIVLSTFIVLIPA